MHNYLSVATWLASACFLACTSGGAGADAGLPGSDLPANSGGTAGRSTFADAAAGGGGSGGGAGRTTGADTAGRGGRPGSGGAAGQTTIPGDAGAGTDLMNPAPGSKFFVGANFWRIDWEGPDDFFVPRTDFATTTNPWQPQLLQDLAPYKVLRFMDWNLANDDPNPQAVWSTRKQKTQSQTSEPIAFEWQIDLCNRALKDLWLAVPIQGDAAYQQSLAQLVYQLLDPRLRVYVEYDNEVWNGSFPQAGIALAAANRLNLPVEANSCCQSDTIKTGSAYVYGAVRLFEQFESVFGKGNPRLVKVLSGQAAWDGPCQVHMRALKNTTLNPNGTMPTVYAIAPYFGGKSIAELQADIANTAKYTTAHVKCAGQLDLPVIAYEGGSDSYSAPNNGCTTLQHDPGMYALYQTYYDAHVAAGMTGPFGHYTHVGACWGLKEKTSDSLDVSPKYKGVVDWLAAHP